MLLLLHTLHLAEVLCRGLMAAAGAFVRAAVAPPERLINCYAGRAAGHRCLQPRRSRRHILWRQAFAAASLILGLAALGQAATPPGTLLTNQARVEYTLSPGGTQFITTSNLDRVITRSPASIDFLIHTPSPPGTILNLAVSGTEYSTSGLPGGPFLPVAAPAETVTQPVPLTLSDTFHVGDILYLRLTDLDQNLNPAAQETVLITVTCSTTGDSELLLFFETGPDTGVFTGYLPTTPAGAPGDGQLRVIPQSRITASYTDIVDNTDTASSSALIDPYGFVFDSLTGMLLNDATITLWDENANAPAVVKGDDGISDFPATVTTGGSASDSGGTLYTFPTGGYRFPLVSPGTYRLIIVPPAGYTSPSAVGDASLQLLPGAPWALVTGSRGEPFIINPGPALRIDVPADPAGGAMFLRKDVNRDDAAIGDFLQYRLTLENTSAAPAPQVQITDHLPLGFRYRAGSLRIDGAKAANPAISQDGRDLTIPLGDLPAAARIAVTYVVEIGAGARIGKATNRASATDSLGNVTNTASATVRVKDDFFRSDTFLLGEVLSGACDPADDEKIGMAGVRIYLEDGTYTVTDAFGRYHFEGVKPGVHVVQLDTTTLPPGYEMLPCESSSQSAGRTFSRFVDLQGGTLWRVNFNAAPMSPPSGAVSLAMQSSLDGTVAGYRIQVEVADLPAEHLRLSVMLPGSSRYRAGSSRLNGNPLQEPEAHGPAVTFRLGDVPAGWSGEITLDAEIDTSLTAGELISKAVLAFDTPTQKNQRTPLAETAFRLDASVATDRDERLLYPRYPSFVAALQPDDQVMIDRLAEEFKDREVVRVDIIGHTDNVEISPRSRHIFADNYALSRARADSVASYLRQKLPAIAGKISISGVADTLPVADNSTEAGRSRNRRVELTVQAETTRRTIDLITVRPDSGRQITSTTGPDPTAAIGPAETSAAGNDPANDKMPDFDKSWLARAETGTRWLWPLEGFNPAMPSTRLAIMHPTEAKITVLRNGEPLPAITYAGMQRGDKGYSVSRWEGVGLQEGTNRFHVNLNTPQGQSVASLSHDVHYGGHPVSAELLSKESLLRADGISQPRLVIRLLDKDGRPARRNLNVEYTVEPPHQPLRSKSKDLYETAVVDSSGRITVDLQPVGNSGAARINLRLIKGDAPIEAWLASAPRDWILVGFAAGTVGYNTVSGNQVSLDEADIDEHFYDDGQVKFFAKGAIKGEWLLTLAYDSDKPDLDGDSLRQTIDPDTYYPLYGDGTQQGYEASSARSLYVKLERDQFYALFGDMQTGLTQTELSRYSRSMNGFKSELQTENFSYTLFAADTKQAFVKDEIRGDGTSGRYFLLQNKLVINSEEVTIETRDRFRSELILESRTLTRHTDYDIDYDNGSLFFKQPVASKDQNFNPVFIVVRYETMDSADSNFNYGGRIAAKVLDQKVEIGASYIHEEKGSGEGDLYGTDVTVELTPQTTIHAEAATTETRHYNEKSSGDAYLAEVTHEANQLRGSVYYREQQEGFGLGQQNGSEDGTRKYGLEGSYDITPRQSVAGLAYHEDNLGTGGERDVAEITGRYLGEHYSLHTGVREARDRLGDGSTQRSTQGLVGGSWTTANRKLTLRSEYEQSLRDSNENSDYPTLLTLGADYLLSEKVSVYAEQEYSWGAQEDAEGTRAGFRATPWQGGTLNSSVERQFNENGQRVFALFGLGQTWQVTEHWSVDASLDRSHTLKHPGNDSFNSNVPPAHGASEDFTAVSVGATYKRDKWTWWNRLEVRQAESEDKVGVSTSVVGEPRDGVAVSAKALAFVTEASEGVRRTDGNLRLGLAYRPAASRWVFLNRLDFYFETEDGGPDKYDSWRIVNNFHANYRLSRRLQTSFYSGLKYVRDTFSGDSYSGFTSLVSFEARYNLNQRWDLGVHGSVLHSWNSGNFDYSAGASVGYSPLTNTWVSVGYNFVGFRDDDFATANYTAQGAYMRFRAKFDQQSVRDVAEWINR